MWVRLRLQMLEENAVIGLHLKQVPSRSVQDYYNRHAIALVSLFALRKTFCQEVSRFNLLLRGMYSDYRRMMNPLCERVRLLEERRRPRGTRSEEKKKFTKNSVLVSSHVPVSPFGPPCRNSSGTFLLCNSCVDYIYQTDQERHWQVRIHTYIVCCTLVNKHFNRKKEQSQSTLKNIPWVP